MAGATRTPTFEECLDAAYAEYVRGWHDTHCLWCGAAGSPVCSDCL